MTDKSSSEFATLDAFEKWWKANAYKFPQADYASSSYEEIARAAWEARATTLQNAAPRASSTQDSTRTGDDIGPSARHPTEKETGGAPAVAAPETTVSETAHKLELAAADRLRDKETEAWQKLLDEKSPSSSSALEAWAKYNKENSWGHEETAKGLFVDGFVAASAPSAIERKGFGAELTALINRYSCENESNTPDFILAAYLGACLDAFDAATVERERWHGREPSAPTTGEAK